MGHPFPHFVIPKFRPLLFLEGTMIPFLDMMYFFHLICTLGWIAVKQFNFWTPKIRTGHKFWTSMILKLRTPPFFQQTCCPKLENLYRTRFFLRNMSDQVRLMFLNFSPILRLKCFLNVSYVNNVNHAISPLSNTVGVFFFSPDAIISK